MSNVISAREFLDIASRYASNAGKRGQMNNRYSLEFLQAGTHLELLTGSLDFAKFFPQDEDYSLREANLKIQGYWLVFDTTRFNSMEESRLFTPAVLKVQLPRYSEKLKCFVREVTEYRDEGKANIFAPAIPNHEEMTRIDQRIGECAIKLFQVSLAIDGIPEMH